MISRRMMDEYRRMNSAEASTFCRWLALNAVAGAFVFTLLAIAAITWGGEPHYQIP
jgi:hypothetical protein